ncbi:MAG: helix-turn-helix transcriptional regulator [Pseudomonadota bacterium]
MKRTIDATLIKKLRQQRTWSQDELAIAAGLSTRTVQRIEADGAGATSSIKALAAALEINLHNLERTPRTEAIGVRWGFGGVGIGVIASVTGIVADYVHGGGSAQEAGISLGVVGFIAGLSCALIGWASSRA